MLQNNMSPSRPHSRLQISTGIITITKFVLDHDVSHRDAEKITSGSELPPKVHVIVGAHRLYHGL